ncbi:PREDICTED: adrenodoxin [Nicrophorus vespilloides]|uniref:Adrenodoxin n=1 Tax=Nicrophorus vespilloides TaxID=110193 RepID=A0ABM1MND8_NICVS|nr:PREDICTED: adrenodoxin [Nicrophorus vespilloides]
MALVSNLLKYSLSVSTKIVRNSKFRNVHTTGSLFNQKLVKVTFIRANGDKIETKGKIGDSLLDVVVNNNLDIDGFGACEGTLTCSTCHLILDPDVYKSLPEGPCEEENDMLDLAYEVSETSRLGCQIILSEKLDGLEVKLPSTINDAREN